MSKKAKIIIISGIIATLLFGGIIYSSTQKNDNNTASTEQSVEQSNDEEDSLKTDNKDFEQPEIKQADGEKFEVFQSKVEELGFKETNDKKYEFKEGEKSLVELDVDDTAVVYKINSKSDNLNDSIKSSFKMLFPNSFEKLYKIIKEDKLDQTISLDNRTVSIEFKDEVITILIM